MNQSKIRYHTSAYRICDSEDQERMLSNIEKALYSTLLAHKQDNTKY